MDSLGSLLDLATVGFPDFEDGGFDREVVGEVVGEEGTAVIESKITFGLNNAMFPEIWKYFNLIIW